MSDTTPQATDRQVNKAAFYAAVLVVLSGIASLFFPLDAPEGKLADRILWLSNNLGAFTTGWLIQMIAMLTLTVVFAGAVWQIRQTNPLKATAAGTALLTSLIAFLIPKFIALWSIPQMVTESATVATHSQAAERLLQLLNPSVPFSLFTSFDYLGFWMYAVFGLFVAGPLFRMSLSAKIAGVAFGVYGLLYHVLFAGVVAGSVTGGDVEAYTGSLMMLLAVSVVALAILFRKASKE